MIYLFKKKQEKLLLTSDVEKIVTVKERHYWKFIKQILFLLNYILFIIKICQMCKIKSHWMFSVVFFMFYKCVICDCVCVLKYAIYLIWPRQFSFGPDSSHLAHVFLIWLIPWPEQKMSQRGPWSSAINNPCFANKIIVFKGNFWQNWKDKRNAKCLFMSDWFYKINLLVLQLAPCDFLQLAPKKDFINKVSYFR